MTAAHTFPQERRAHPRHRVFKRARAVFNHRSSVMDVVLRDLSAGGARLSCANAALLPDRFELVVLAEREICDVRVAWRSLDEAGIEFLSPPRKALHLLI